MWKAHSLELPQAENEKMVLLDALKFADRLLSHLTCNGLVPVLLVVCGIKCVVNMYMQDHDHVVYARRMQLS